MSLCDQPWWVLVIQWAIIVGGSATILYNVARLRRHRLKWEAKDRELEAEHARLVQALKDYRERLHSEPPAPPGPTIH